jgi:hypothetical protein
MIHFRCWFCNRGFMMSPERAGGKFRCGCGRSAKVPKRAYGSSKIILSGERLMEAVVYGLLCATFSLGLSFVAVSRAALFRANFTPLITVSLTGLIAGALFGERTLNYFGRKLRDRENR